MREGEHGSEPEQRANLRRTADALAAVACAGPLVVTHGNGPQVGNELLRHDCAAPEVPALPLWLAVAQTQAEIGALVASELAPVCGRPPVVVLTHVVVDARDPALAEPTKPIGPYYEAAVAGALAREHGWRLGEVPGRGHRRLVGSPEPREVVELGAIRALVGAGEPLVACGGGGIPVVVRHGRFEGVDAVVDKDRSSALLATALGARRLVVLTDVAAVERDHGTERAEPIGRLTPDEAKRLAPALAAGSMGPKVAACARFTRATGADALITSADRLADALAGRAGTWIAASG